MHIHLPHSPITDHEITLRGRFITRVLMPPFVVLLLIGSIGFWQLNSYLTRQAIDELETAAQATAVRLDRELSLRQTILATTGEEIALIRDVHGSSRHPIALSVTTTAPPSGILFSCAA